MKLKTINVKKFDDIDIGNYVYYDDKIGVVIDISETYLHSHPFVRIYFFSCGFYSGFATRKFRFYLPFTIEKIIFK